MQSSTGPMKKIAQETVMNAPPLTSLLLAEDAVTDARAAITESCRSIGSKLNVQRFPEDLLARILAYVGLEHFHSIALVCSEFRRAAAALTSEWQILAYERSVGSKGRGKGQFWAPSYTTQVLNGEVAITDSATDQVHIMDTASASVRCTLNGEHESAFPFISYSSSARFSSPSGIVCGPDDSSIYLADSGNGRIVHLDLRSSAWRQVYGRTGSADDELMYPQGLVKLPCGSIVVVDMGNHRLVVLDEILRLVGHYGERGMRRGAFESPHGIAADGDGKLLVADTGNHRVQLLQPLPGSRAAYAVSRVIGGEGKAPGRFREPRGVAFVHRLIVVAEFEGRRVQVLNATGRPLQVVPLAGCGRLCGLWADPLCMHAPPPTSTLHSFFASTPGSSSTSKSSPTTAVTSTTNTATTTSTTNPILPTSICPSPPSPPSLAPSFAPFSAPFEAGGYAVHVAGAEAGCVHVLRIARPAVLANCAAAEQLRRSEKEELGWLHKDAFGSDSGLNMTLRRSQIW
uniref:F-box domain-containing protein n=1 Tax=Chrysotila carterae TaxID=13221 RepID=A0A7S4BIR0_CHRCT